MTRALQSEGEEKPGTSELPLESTADDSAMEDSDPVIPGSAKTQTVLGLEVQTGTLLDDQSQIQRNNDSCGEISKRNNFSVSFLKHAEDQSSSGSYQARGADLRGQGTEVRRLAFDDDASDFQLERIPSRKPGKLPTKVMKNLEFNQKYTRKEGGVSEIIVLFFL